MQARLVPVPSWSVTLPTGHDVQELAWSMPPVWVPYVWKAHLPTHARPKRPWTHLAQPEAVM